MSEIEEEIKVGSKIRVLIEISWNAIKQRHVLKLSFVSNSGNIGVREIKPYMVYINDKREIRVVGLPRNLWQASIDHRDPGQYLLEKIDVSQIEVLSEKFGDPGVPRDIVVKTKIVKVICRFIYDDEDMQEVIKTWVKIDGLELR